MSKSWQKEQDPISEILKKEREKIQIKIDSEFISSPYFIEAKYNGFYFLKYFEVQMISKKEITLNKKNEILTEKIYADEFNTKEEFSKQVNNIILNYEAVIREKAREVEDSQKQLKLFNFSNKEGVNV